MKFSRFSRIAQVCLLLLGIILVPIYQNSFLELLDKSKSYPIFLRLESTMQSPKVKFGLSLSNRSIQFGWTTLEDLLNAARFAEDSGKFHSLWIGDNLLSKPRPESIVVLSALATQTKKMKLGTICFASLPLRDPILLAIQWASLDVLSGGRTILGACIGPSAKDGARFAHELKVMGIGSNERVGRLIESITLLRRFWNENQVTHKGKYYCFQDVELLPKPTQQSVPIYIASNPKEERVGSSGVERVLRRIAKHSDGWQTTGTSAQTFAERANRIREYAVQEGRNPSKLEFSMHLSVNINNDPKKAFKEATEYLGQYFPSQYRARQKKDSWIIYGPPENVIKTIQSYIKAGCTLPLIRFVSKNTQEQMERFFNDVLPALK